MCTWTAPTDPHRPIRTDRSKAAGPNAGVDLWWREHRLSCPINNRHGEALTAEQRTINAPHSAT